MSRSNGISTKYFDKYVNYFREFHNKIDTFNQLLHFARMLQSGGYFI